jgi:hypothetical protein
MSMYRLQDEPKLNELLADPILHLLLKRDGVSLEKLQDLIEQARRRRWGAKRAQLQQQPRIGPMDLESPSNPAGQIG